VRNLSPEQLHDPFEKALREDHLVPICFCSARRAPASPSCLEVLAKLAPNPTEGNPPPFLKGEGADAVRVEVSPDPAQHVIAHVFKVTIDPFVGKLGVFRVHQGTVKTGAQLLVGDGRKPVKLAHLYRLQGKENIEVPQAIPGDICAVAKIDELHFDAVLHDSHDEDHHHLKSVASRRRCWGWRSAPRSAATSRSSPRACTGSRPRILACAWCTIRRRTKRSCTASATCTCASCCSVSPSATAWG